MPELNQTSLQETPSMGIKSPNEPHLACALLLDTSISMAGAPLESLMQGIAEFKEVTKNNADAQSRVDIAVIEFNDAPHVIQEFSPLPELRVPNLTARGCTAMGAAINLAIDKVKERNREYAELGTPCYQPWIFMITDGEPTDDITTAQQRIYEEEHKGKYGKLKFWTIGVPGYNREVAHSLSKRLIELEKPDFSGIFQWLSESVSIISVSRVDENPQLTNLPEGSKAVPRDW